MRKKASERVQRAHLHAIDDVLGAVGEAEQVRVLEELGDPLEDRDGLVECDRERDAVQLLHRGQGRVKRQLW